MATEIRQVHPLFVGEASGIELGRPLDPASCSMTSICTRPGPNSSAATNGGLAIWSAGTTAARCLRRATTLNVASTLAEAA